MHRLGYEVKTDNMTEILNKANVVDLESPEGKLMKSLMESPKNNLKKKVKSPSGTESP